MKAVVTPIDEHDLYPCHEEDTVPQGDPHFWQVHYLGGATQAHRPDLRVTCDICHYWEPGNKKRYVAPDVSVIAGPLPAHRPNVYLAWLDPPLLLTAEIASPSKRRAQVRHKQAIYEFVLQVPEHLDADPERGLLALWQWGEHGYRAVPPDPRGRVWSESLGLGFGYDEAGFLRLYTRAGEMLLTQEEEKERADSEAQRADVAAQRAEGEARRANREAQRRAEAEQQAQAEAQRRAEAEQQAQAETQRRAEAEQQAQAETQRRAEAERRLAELTAELARLRRNGGPAE